MVQAARCRFQQCNNNAELKKEYETLFRKLQGKFRRSVRRAKWSHYRSNLEDIDQNRPFGLHFDWSRDRSSNLLKLSGVVGRGGSKTSDFSSTIGELMQYHFSSENEENRLVQNEIGDFAHRLGDDDLEFIKRRLRCCLYH